MAALDGHERSADGTNGATAPQLTRAALLDFEPELVRLLTDEQRAEAQEYVLAATSVEPGTEIAPIVRQAGAFGAVITEGLVAHRVHIEERASLRLIGPGGLVPVTPTPASMPLATVITRATTRTRIVLLDNRFLLAAGRWPHLTALLHARAMEQWESLSLQLGISHLPRVEDRIMALMGLLAADWGHVTPAGIRLQLGLTHDALGELIGAQRPTVTLALKELASRGSLIRQDNDWLILDPPPEPSQQEPARPRLLHEPEPGAVWKARPEPEPVSDRLTHLRAELVRLRDQYAADHTLARELRTESDELRLWNHQLVDEARALGRTSAVDGPAGIDGE